MLAVGASTTDGAFDSGVLSTDIAVGEAMGASSVAHAAVAPASKALHASQTAAIAQNRKLLISLSNANAD